MREIGCQTIWTTKVEAQISDLLNEKVFGCATLVVKPYGPLRLKYKVVIC